MSNPSWEAQRHMVRVLDAYTLLAFLQQTPDVQKAFSKVLSEARIWLDTTAVLPLLAETLIDDPERRPQTTLLNAAWSSGVKLFVTNGVINEIVSHMNRSLACSHTPSATWEGNIPYLYSAHALTGRGDGAFAEWVDGFKGDVFPEQDVQDYLEEHHHIKLHDLEGEADKASTELRSVVEELFREGRAQREDSSIIDLLSHNDMVSAVGVMQLRTESRPALGYQEWWLTLDHTAFKLGPRLREWLGKDAPQSPVLSPDYLSQLLRLGPLRKSLVDDNLPVSVDLSTLQNLPPQLIQLARETRESCAGFDELRTRREVRDAIHRAQTTFRQGADYGGMTRQPVKAAIQSQVS